MIKKKQMMTLTISLFIFFAIASCVKSEQGKQAADKPKGAATDVKGLETEMEKLSYAMGMQIGNSLKSIGAEIDLPIFYKAIEDQLEGRESLLTMQEAMQIQRRSIQKLRAQLAEKNKAEGEAFLSVTNKPQQHRYSSVMSVDSSIRMRFIELRGNS